MPSFGDLCEHLKFLETPYSLTPQRCQTLQDEHATAMKEGHSIQSKASEDIADINSQLQQARSEYSAEREGRATDQQQAESTADELKATIQRLEDAYLADVG